MLYFFTLWFNRHYEKIGSVFLSLIEIVVGNSKRLSVIAKDIWIDFQAINIVSFELRLPPYCGVHLQTRKFANYFLISSIGNPSCDYCQVSTLPMKRWTIFILLVRCPFSLYALKIFILCVNVFTLCVNRQHTLNIQIV